MKILRDARYRELLECERTHYRVLEAYRWLSEFDGYLDPLWAFLKDKTRSIEKARELMRRVFPETKTAREGEK